MQHGYPNVKMFCVGYVQPSATSTLAGDLYDSVSNKLHEYSDKAKPYIDKTKEYAGKAGEKITEYDIYSHKHTTHTCKSAIFGTYSYFILIAHYEYRLPSSVGRASGS